MSQLTSRTERCNNNLLDGSQHEQQSNLGDLFPFPGFIVNNTDVVEDYTPIAKIPCGSVQKCANYVKPIEETPSSTTTKTPPVEPSVSPEIQSSFRHSALVLEAAPSACYGAGHVISGVTDKRKCKARGILSVVRSKALEQDISEDNINCMSHDKRRQYIFRKSRPSLIPFPVEASINWHLSPSYADNYDGVVRQGAYPKGLHQSSEIVNPAALPSPSSPNRSLCTLSNPEFQGLKSSPCDTPEAVISQEERISSFDFNSECSPFSGNSLSSRNVIQTPNSDSSLERHGGLSWLKEGIPKHQFESELDQVTDVLQHESLSPLDLSRLDPPRLGTELEDLSSPSSLTSLKHLKENLDSHASWISDSTLESVSESHMRISWRDGFVSGTFDKDDLDCCRLSDEEMDADGLLKSPRLPEHKVRADGNDTKTSFSTQLDPCAESICTDRDRLIASGDSDWTFYYKDRSFEM